MHFASFDELVGFGMWMDSWWNWLLVMDLAYFFSFFFLPFPKDWGSLRMEVRPCLAGLGGCLACWCLARWRGGFGISIPFAPRSSTLSVDSCAFRRRAIGSVVEDLLSCVEIVAGNQ